MREHRALRAPGRARGVEDRGKVVRPRHHRREFGGRARRAFEQRAGTGRERQRDTLGTQRRHRFRGLRAADDHARLGVAEEVRELALLVAGIERQEHEPGAQAAEIQGERLPALVDLRSDAVAGDAAIAAQHVGDSCRHALEIVVMNDRTAGNDEAGLLGVLREMVGEEAVEIRVHRRAAGRGERRRPASLRRPAVRNDSTMWKSSLRGPAAARGEVYEISPAPRAHWYFAPSTATGISVE